MRLLLFLVGAAVVAGCGTQTVPGGEGVERELESIRSRPGRPVYYLGREFAGLPLTHVGPARAGTAFFVYGTCEIPRGIDAGGCAPPVQVQIFPFREADWELAAGCRRLRSLRGVPTVRHDGLVLVTARTVVKIYAGGGAGDRRAARALRAVRNGPGVGDTLPPPPRDVVSLLGEACGKRPGEGGL